MWKSHALAALAGAVVAGLLSFALLGPAEAEPDRERSRPCPDEAGRSDGESDWGIFEDDGDGDRASEGRRRRGPRGEGRATEHARPPAEPIAVPSTPLAHPDAGVVPAAVAACVERPDVRAFLDAEVLRRIEEHDAEERAAREAERAARREEARARLESIGVGEAELAQLGPSVCAMRARWREDARALEPAARSENVRASITALRAEIATVLGPERNALLEEIGGGRAIGRAVDCPELETP